MIWIFITNYLRQVLLKYQYYDDTYYENIDELIKNNKLEPDEESISIMLNRHIGYIFNI